MIRRNANKIRQTREDTVFSAINIVLMVLVLVVTLYPLYFVLIASVSDPTYVNSGEMLLYPKGFTLLGYQRVFSDSRISIGYMNTIIYTVGGTAFGTIACVMAGYSLSRDDLPGRGILMGIMVFTMYFGGGLIPFYLIVKGLHLTNTRLAMILFGSVSVYNIILVRSYFSSSLAKELQEAAFIDGCGNGRYFWKIVLPISKPIIAVIALYIAVTHWNSYFNAMIFLTDRNKYPLPLYLREILLTASTAQSSATGQDAEDAQKLEQMVQIVKYGVIVVTTIPIICVYPFIQKYFVKGVMIGSIKG